MSLDKEQVQQIAVLARLKLADDEFGETVDKLSRIVDFVDQLSQASTDSVVPMAHPLDVAQRLRQDEVSEEIDREQVRTAVTEVLRDLSPRERKILDWRFGLDNGGTETVTLGEIGKRLGISRERVRQIECAALARLRRAPSVRRLRGGMSAPARTGERRR